MATIELKLDDKTSIFVEASSTMGRQKVAGNLGFIRRKKARDKLERFLAKA